MSLCRTEERIGEEIISYGTDTYWMQGRDNAIMVTVVREEDSCGVMAVKMEMEW